LTTSDFYIPLPRIWPDKKLGWDSSNPDSNPLTTSELV